MTSPLQLTVDCGAGLSLSTSFRFEAGCYRHWIILSRGDDVTLDCWTDQMRSADDDWPASPPIQQLSLEMIHGAAVLLGVGQAGKSHWSVSVETIQGSSRPALQFDLACRCRVRPPWLGSSYARQRDAAGLTEGLTLIPGEATSQFDDDAAAVARCQIDPSGSRKYPSTFRWSYRIEVA